MISEKMRKAHKKSIKELQALSFEELLELVQKNTEHLSEEEKREQFRFYTGRLWEEDE